MKTLLISTLAAGFVASTALAAPMELTDVQLDQVAAGSYHQDGNGKGHEGKRYGHKRHRGQYYYPYYYNDNYNDNDNDNYNDNYNENYNVNNNYIYISIPFYGYGGHDGGRCCGGGYPPHGGHPKGGY